MDDPTLRLYAIIRGDLCMTAGKMAAQAGHAYLDTYLRACDLRPRDAVLYLSDSHGTKITLSADSLDGLIDAHNLAKKAGIPSVLITDAHHVMLPHFDGSPIVTALGIGPVTRAEVRHITDKFELVR